MRFPARLNHLPAKWPEIGVHDTLGTVYTRTDVSVESDLFSKLKVRFLQVHMNSGQLLLFLALD